PSARAAPEVPSPTPRPTPEELPVEARDPSDTTEESAEGEPAPAPPAPDRSSADAADLPPNFGLLLVESSQNDAIVYIQGREVGPVNQKLEVECGVRFLRLGTSPLSRWYTPGRAYGVTCQGLTTLKIDPHSEPVRSYAPKRQFLKR